MDTDYFNKSDRITFFSNDNWRDEIFGDMSILIELLINLLGFIWQSNDVLMRKFTEGFSGSGFLL